MLRLAIEALDLGVVVLGPQTLDLLAKGRITGRGGRFDALFFCSKADLLLGRGGGKM